jgi:DNA-binding transcriptional ArsR family regulator
VETERYSEREATGTEGRIREALRRSGSWLTYAELAAEVGVSRSTVQEHVKRLAKGDRVATDRGGSNGAARVRWSAEGLGFWCRPLAFSTLPGPFRHLPVATLSMGVVRVSGTVAQSRMGSGLKLPVPSGTFRHPPVGTLPTVRGAGRPGRRANCRGIR